MLHLIAGRYNNWKVDGWIDRVVIFGICLDCFAVFITIVGGGLMAN